MFTSEETVAALGLSEEQKQKVAKIDEELTKERTALFQNRDGDREAARKKMDELNKTAKQNAEAVLTAEQKAKWTAMIALPSPERSHSAGGEDAADVDAETVLAETAPAAEIAPNGRRASNRMATCD